MAQNGDGGKLTMKRIVSTTRIVILLAAVMMIAAASNTASAYMSDREESTYRLWQGWIDGGRTIVTVNVLDAFVSDTVDECENACRDGECDSWTYEDWSYIDADDSFGGLPGHTCYLLDDDFHFPSGLEEADFDDIFVNPEVDSDYISGVKIPDCVEMGLVLENTSLDASGSARDFRARSYLTCFNDCAFDHNCNAWSFQHVSGESSGTCFIMHEEGVESFSHGSGSGFTSGYKDSECRPLIPELVGECEGATTEEDRRWCEAHNVFRRAHCVPEVSWSERLAAQAQLWANTCPDLSSPHSPQDGYYRTGADGENMFVFFGGYEIEEAVNIWYSEVANYERNGGFEDPPFSIHDYVNANCGGLTDRDYERCVPENMIGHFTQVVWRATTEIGCAASESPCDGDFDNVWVCQYSNDRGNREGLFGANVNRMGVCPLTLGPPVPADSSGYGGDWTPSVVAEIEPYGYAGYVPFSEDASTGADIPSTTADEEIEPYIELFKWNVVVALDAGKAKGKVADWSILANTAKGWFYYNKEKEAWLPDLRVTYRKALADSKDVVSLNGLPSTVYQLYFVIDLYDNGKVDLKTDRTYVASTKG
jgi:hypothetical protein